MKKHEAVIQSGIGFHDAPNDAAMRADVTEDFLSSHCVNQELYQDIKNAVRNVYNREVTWRRDLLPRSADPILFTQVRVYDAHRVAEIKIGILTKNFHRVYANVRLIDSIFVSLTEDGMVTDIVDRPKVMNPANGRAVHPHKW